VVVGQVRAGAQRGARAGLRVPEHQAAVRARQHQPSVGKGEQAADVALRHSGVPHRIEVPEGLAVPDREAARRVVCGRAPAREPDAAIGCHRGRLDGDDVSFRGHHEDRLIAERGTTGTLVRIAERDRVDLVPGTIEPAGEVLRPPDLPRGPAAAHPQLAIRRERQPLPIPEPQVALGCAAGVVVADLRMQVIGHPVVRRGEKPLPLARRAVLVRPDAVDAVIGPHVQLVRMQEVIVEEPLVLRLVGGRADHRLFQDPFDDAVLRVRAAPRTRAPEAGARAESELRSAATRREQRDGGRPSQGRTLSTAAPPAVATIRAGGSTIVSSWSRSTRSLGMPWPARMGVFAPVTGSQITSPL